jgi:type II secretory pathway pseudopilin PulG
MGRSKRILGVTLIELLVVISVMMTVLGLVGGTVVDSIDRARAQTEVIIVYSLVKKTSASAFSSGAAIFLEFSESSAIVSTGDNEQEVYHFDYLDFDRLNMAFNRNGMPNKFVIPVKVRGIPRRLEVLSFFEASFVKAESSEFAHDL